VEYEKEFFGWFDRPACDGVYSGSFGWLRKFPVFFIPTINPK
jgi:hypothetical protein